MSNNFQHLIAIQPLGFLYGSTGAFLSPENLVGRAGTKFPPSAATLSGIFAASAAAEIPPRPIRDLRVAGPFWAKLDNPQNFYVPTPLNAVVQSGRSIGLLQWHEDEEGIWRDSKGKPSQGKPEADTWVAIDDWDRLGGASDREPIAVADSPWKEMPHLHPRLEHAQRHVNEQEGRGSLFLENAILLDPEVCLVYLSNLSLKAGWYRFGGEGHMVEIYCHDLSPSNQARFSESLGFSFATIVPSLWGSNRLSQRMPPAWEQGECRALMTQRPKPFRYRLGGKGTVKRLSRGRYAVPAGSVYVMDSEHKAWVDWADELFPKEGPHMNRWGCGLSLPLPEAVASA